MRLVNLTRSAVDEGQTRIFPRSVVKQEAVPLAGTLHIETETKNATRTE